MGPTNTEFDRKQEILSTWIRYVMCEISVAFAKPDAVVFRLSL